MKRKSKAELPNWLLNSYRGKVGEMSILGRKGENQEDGTSPSAVA